MAPKIEKAGKMKRKSLNDDENVSHIQPTNLNKKFANVRRRFSTRLFKNDKTSLPGSLQPCMSRGHSSASSATDGIQQLDVLPAQTIPSACQETEIEAENEAECSPPSVSLKLTEMVAMEGHDDDSETQSQVEDNDNVYHVKPEYMGILRKIIDKHGDIAEECQVKTVKCRSMLLENICEIISKLDDKDFRNLKGVEKMIDLIKDVKSMNVKVDWLLTRLTEILEAREAFKEGSKLKEKTDGIKEFIEAANNELKEIEVKKKEICDSEAFWKERLAAMEEVAIMTTQKVKDVTSKVNRFLKCSSLIDGLL